MIIDFKEIPKANISNGEQDRFEQFASDFLETIGYKILQGPNRGPDGKKDLIVSEILKRIGGSEKEIKWIVSCKHNAHSGKAVKDTDEPDILDRVKKHKCDGFLGFFSTLPAATLSDKLNGLKGQIDCDYFDSTRIERELLRSKDKNRLLASYFPESHDKYLQNLHSKDLYLDHETPARTLTEDDVLRISKTAIIILEVEKIKEQYSRRTSKEWWVREDIFNKLYRFTDHSNEQVAAVIFSALELIGDLRLEKQPSTIASFIKSVIVTYFPASFGDNNQMKIENGRRCIQLGFSLAYTGFIHLNNLKTAEYGLSILKYIYQKAKQSKITELTKVVLEEHDYLKEHLQGRGRNDLENAKEFLSIYRSDLETNGLLSPDIPVHLFKLWANG